MRWSRISFALVLAASFVASACADRTPSSPRNARNAIGENAALVCSADINDLLAQAAVIFGAGSPNYNSVRGKLENLQHHLDNSNPNEAKVRAHDIVDFVLTKYAEGGLPGTPEQVSTFLTGVYCLAGLNITVGDPNGSELIFPSDSAQIVYGLNNTAGVSFPAFPVIEPSLVTIETYDGLLNTKLDQYPGFIKITLQSETNAALTGTVTVSVCATGVPASVDFSNMRLGHGVADTGFVITPLPTASDPVVPSLMCEPEAASMGIAQRMWQAVKSTFGAQALHASTSTSVLRAGGGVSGTVTEFSPFAPVDTELRMGGGVSGTVTEFIREPMPSSALLSDGVISLVDEPSSCAEIPAGSALPAECYPIATIRTAQGTLLSGVPVDWSIPALSGGTIAPRTGDLGAMTCGDFGRTAATETSANGNAGICWSLGGEGTYEVSARARFGGDAPEGVTFDNNGTDTLHFSVTVAPVTIQIVSGNNQTAPAGSTLPLPPTVRVLNRLGQPAAGVVVDWTALANSDASTAPSTSTTDGMGLASTSWTIGAGYNELRASIRNASDTAVTFVANGSSGTVGLNACPVGNSSDPINDPSKPYAFWMPNPGLGSSINEVDLFFSASGKANRPSDYRIALVTRLGGFNQATLDSTVVSVELRGSASEAKRATFRLDTPVVGSNGRSAPAVTMQLIVLTNPDNATVRFNTGTCPPGQNCKVPKGCAVTEVSAPTPFPLGTFYRKTVGISVRGTN
jgi:hypothetical protein